MVIKRPHQGGALSQKRLDSNALLENEQQFSLMKFAKDYPQPLTEIIAPRMHVKSKSALACTSRYFHSLFKYATFEYLTRLVIKADYAKVRELLSSGINLHWIFEKQEKIVDGSDRAFHDYSLFRYVVWAWDTRILRIFLEKIRSNGSLVNEAAVQLYEQENSQDEHGAHYDFSDLISPFYSLLQPNYCYRGQPHDEYNLHNKTYNSTANWTSAERLKYFIEVLGGAQRRIPAHIVNYLCNSYRYYQTLNDYKLVPKLSSKATYLNSAYEDGVKISWFPLEPNKGLGFEYAVCQETSEAFTTPLLYPHNSSYSKGTVFAFSKEIPTQLNLCYEFEYLLNLRQGRMTEFLELEKLMNTPFPTKKSCAMM